MWNTLTKFICLILKQIITTLTALFYTHIISESKSTLNQHFKLLLKEAPHASREIQKEIGLTIE